MTTTMSATEARIHFGEVLRRVENKETITVERGGQPKAVIMSIEEYEKLRSSEPEQEDCRSLLMESRERFRKALGGQEIDVDELIHTMREEREEHLLNGLH